MIQRLILRRVLIELPLVQFLSQAGDGPRISVVTGKPCGELSELHASLTSRPPSAARRLTLELQRWNRPTLHGFLPIESIWLLRAAIAEYAGMLVLAVGLTLSALLTPAFIPFAASGAALWVGAILLVPSPVVVDSGAGPSQLTLYVHRRYASALADDQT